LNFLESQSSLAGYVKLVDPKLTLTTVSGGRSQILLLNELCPQSDKSLEFHSEEKTEL